MAHRAGFSYSVLPPKKGLPIFLGLLGILIILFVIKSCTSDQVGAPPTTGETVRTAGTTGTLKMPAVSQPRLTIRESVLGNTMRTVELSLEEPTKEMALSPYGWVKFWLPPDPDYSLSVRPRQGFEIYFLDGYYEDVMPEDDGRFPTHRAIFWIRGKVAGQKALVSIASQEGKIVWSSLRESTPSSLPESQPTTEPSTKPTEVETRPTTEPATRPTEK